MKKNIFIIVLLFVMIGSVIAYKSYQPAENIANENRAGQQEVTENQQNYIAPNFKLMDLNGEKVALKDLEGKVVLINFWNTWCTYCDLEMPEIERTYKKYKDQGFEVLAVNVTAQEENLRDVKRYIEEGGYTFPVLLDETAEVAAIYGIRNLPTSIIVDEQGEIIDAKIGAFTDGELEAKIESLVK